MTSYTPLPPSATRGRGQDQFAPPGTTVGPPGAGTVHSMTTTALAARPLPINSILKVTGVSFRQDAVRKVVELDEVRIVHDQDNQFDAYACEVRTLDGEALGFVPKELAVRLAGPQPGGIWRARIEEVLRNDTWGLRVRVGPLCSVGNPDAGARVAGLRHRGDGTVEAPNGTVALASVDVPQAVAAPSATVYARSGRLLGTLLNGDADRVHVSTPAGAKATYPRSIVEIRSA